MKWLTRRPMLALPLLALPPLAGCGSTLTPVHYRLTLEVDTPDGLRQASNVMAVRYGTQFDINGGGQRGTSQFTGEAVFLDLGGGKNVIMLLAHGPAGQDGDRIKFLPFLFVPPHPAGSMDYLAKGGKLEGKRDLSPQDIPTLITFTDIADPASAKVIYAGGLRQLERFPGTYNYRTEPAVLIDEIAATFGPGYAFRRATIEMVPNGTPVTRGIEKKLPFLVTHRDKLRNQRTAPSDPYIGKFGHFIKE